MRELRDEMRKFLFNYLKAREAACTAKELHAVFKEVFAPLGRKGTLGCGRKNPHPKEVAAELDGLLVDFVAEGKATLGYCFNPDNA